MKQTDFLTVDDFAERLHVPATRVRRWLREGRLPHVRLGRTVKIPKDALERLLDTPGGPLDGDAP